MYFEAKCIDANVARVLRHCAWRFAWLLRGRLPVVSPQWVARTARRLVGYGVARVEKVLRGLGVEPQRRLRRVAREAFRRAWWPHRRQPLFAVACRELRESGPRVDPRGQDGPRGVVRGGPRVGASRHLALGAEAPDVPRLRAGLLGSQRPHGAPLRPWLHGEEGRPGGHPMEGPQRRLVTLPWQEWRSFEQDAQAFHSDTRYLKALMAAAFSDQLLIGWAKGLTQALMASLLRTS